MTHVVTRACCSDAACVRVCPVNCIRPTPDDPDFGRTEMLYIDPAVCIDCGACADVCPVNAIHPDYELPLESLDFEDLNAAYFELPERQNYDTAPFMAASPGLFEGERLQVAIVGSGPAGCYAAEELLRQKNLDVHIDVFDKLMTPGGLVRFGVAPDHPDTKRTADGFMRVLTNPRVRLFLNIEIGADLEMADLQQRYHAVIYAAGAAMDRTLEIPGNALPGNHGAATVVAWYNGHPDARALDIDLSGERAVIIGNGNVALDIARVLASDPVSLAGTDIADHALATLQGSGLRSVEVVGRRTVAEAAFAVKELIALRDAPGIDLVVDRSRGVDGVSTDDPIVARQIAILKNLPDASAEARPGHRRVVLRFLLQPEALHGVDHVEELVLRRTAASRAADGTVQAVPVEETLQVSTRLVVRSVGYRSAATPGVPLAGNGSVANSGGRVTNPAHGTVVTGLYTTGWAKRGANGVIGTNRVCANETVAALLRDFRSGGLAAPTRSADELCALPGRVEAGGWKKIDAHERSEGRRTGRPRVKVVDPAMLSKLVQTSGATR